jgi:hypothetical protein
MVFCASLWLGVFAFDPIYRSPKAILFTPSFKGFFVIFASSL